MVINKDKAMKNIENATNAEVCYNCGAKTVYSGGLCYRCYREKWIQGDKPDVPEKPKKKPAGRRRKKAKKCRTCGNTNVYARGACYKCYKRAYQRGDVTKESIDTSYKRLPTIDPKTGKKKICSFCRLKPVYSEDLCRKCYTRANRNGGNPEYKNPGCERVMRCEQKLQKRREAQDEK